MLKSENSAKNSCKSSPNNSLDWKEVAGGRGVEKEEERNERLCKLSYQIRISKCNFKSQILRNIFQEALLGVSFLLKVEKGGRVAEGVKAMLLKLCPWSFKNPWIIFSRCSNRCDLGRLYWKPAQTRPSGFHPPQGSRMRQRRKFLCPTFDNAEKEKDNVAMSIASSLLSLWYLTMPK